MALHIVQVLCPDRHCIFAFAYEPDGKEITDEKMIQSAMNTIDRMANAGEINRWCGLCGSRDLKAEAAVTRFNTLDEAMPHLKEEEAKQMLTRMLLSPKEN